MRSNWKLRLAVSLFLCAAAARAQDAPLPSGSVSVNLAKDSPVAFLSAKYDQSRVTARGAAMVLDLHISLTFQNISQSRIHGVRLRVVAQEVAAGGKGSVTYPNLSIGPGEILPVNIDMQLVRPTQFAGGPLVQVDLDGVLYHDLSFYGPDRLHSRRFLTAREMEAQRDREYFKRVLGPRNNRKALQDAILSSIARQSEPALNVRVVRGGPAVTNSAVASDRPAQFAFVRFPGAPVEPLEGFAQVTGNEARMPRIEVRNNSGKPVRYVELGWILSDQGGYQSAAAALPSADPQLYLPPGKTARVLQDTSLKLFGKDGRPVSVQKMTGFVSQVEFADGKVWVPNRENLGDPLLVKAVAPSAEEMRLADLYQKKGLDGLIEELKKF
jgi:hypothetical protein